MNTVIQAPDITAAVKAVNFARLANKDEWLFLQLDIASMPGRVILIKSFNTSPQIIREGARGSGINYGGQMDLSVTAWKAVIESALTDIAASAIA